MGDGLEKIIRNLDKHKQKVINNPKFQKFLSAKKLGEDIFYWAASNPNVTSFLFGTAIGFKIYYEQGADSNQDIANGILNGFVGGVGINLITRVNNLLFELKQKSKDIDWKRFLSDPKTLSIAGMAIYYAEHDQMVADLLKGGVIGYLSGLILNDVKSVVKYVKEKTTNLKSMIKENIQNGLELMINHPIVSSIGLNYITFSRIPINSRDIVHETINNPETVMLIPWYIGYVPFGIAKEYGLHKKSRILLETPEESGVVKDLYYWTLNNPKLVGLFTGLTAGGFGAEYYSSSPEEFLLNFIFMSNIFGMVGQSLFSGMKYNKMVQTKPKESIKKIKNTVFSHTYSMFGFHNKALESFEKAMMVPTSSYQKARDNLHLSNLLLKAGKEYDNAIRLQTEAARILKDNELGINHYDLLKSITGVNRITARIAQVRHEIRPDIGKDIGIGLALVAERKYDEGFGVLQEIFEENPDDPLINSVYGYSLISADKREEGIEKFLNIALNLNEIATINDLRPFGGSKTYYIDHPAFGGLFTLKEDKFDVLKGEMDVLLKFIDKILTSKHSKSFYRTVEPIAIMDGVGSDEDFYITLRENGELLVDAGMKNINHVKRAASAQGFYHGTMSEELVKDDISIQQRKIVNRIRNHDVIDDKTKALLIGNVDVTIEDSRYLVFERDGHPYQYIIYKDKVIFIDTENRGYNQSTDDNSKLLFQADYIPREPQSLGLIENILLDYYAESFNNTAAEELRIRNGRNYVRRTLAAAPRKAFSYSSFASGMVETEKARQYFLKNGVFAIDLIIDNFSADYSIFDMKKFENLRKGLSVMIG